MVQIVAVAGLGAVAAVVAWVLRRRPVGGPHQAPAWAVPSQLDRDDFARPEAPWLVAVFTSSTCLACGDAWTTAHMLESDAVAVVRVDSDDDRRLHQRYRIDAVPLLVVADAEGVVRWSHVGPPGPGDLWGALARLREPSG